MDGAYKHHHAVGLQRDTLRPCIGVPRRTTILQRARAAATAFILVSPTLLGERCLLRACASTSSPTTWPLRQDVSSTATVVVVQVQAACKEMERVVGITAS